jgi:predicted  nucleic acid-binding Zn-ribbon protein
MDTLVSKYDQAVEDLIKRDHIISKLTNDLLEAGREIEHLHTSNSELMSKTDSKEKELFDVYASLRRKEELLRNVEEGLNRKISEREDQCIALQSKVEHMEQNFTVENKTIQ